MSSSFSPFLPRFSHESDIVEFVDTLSRFERGELSPEDFRRYRLTRGVYGQRQPSAQMLRAKVPQGILGAAALEALATVAERWGHGHANVTTRQNIQFHFVRMTDVEPAMRALHDAGVTTREACGNTIRNVTTCPFSGVLRGEAFDVGPHGEAITRFFLRSQWANDLPRKFKIALCSGPDDTVFASINDIGLIARVRDGQRGFKMFVGGGLSTTPQGAIVFREFLPEDQLLDACEAVVRVFSRLGNRENKHRARLKYVLRKLGPEPFVQALDEEFLRVRSHGGTALDLAAAPLAPTLSPTSPDTPASLTRSPAYSLWRDSNAIEQSQPGYHAVIVRLALGAITPAQLRGLAELSLRFSNGTVRTTLDQNLLVRFVPTYSLPALHTELAALGLATPGARTVSDVTACPGAETCNLAVTSSRQVAAAITDRIESDPALARVRELARETVIKISGCPNSCGQHHIADIGWHGAARRFGARTAPMYQLHLGGGVDTSGARFGRQVVKIPARRVPEAVVRLIELFAREHTEGERPASFFSRIDALSVQSLLGDLCAVDDSSPDELFLDIGEAHGFKVAIGQGECAA